MNKFDEKGFKDTLTELFRDTVSYRSSDRFHKMLNFVCTHRNHDPYNAALIELQKPTALFALTVKQWRKYNRQPKPNAQAILKLVPFGPFVLIYDYEDTEIIEDLGPKLRLEQICDDFYRTMRIENSNTFSRFVMHYLTQNLPLYGIVLRPNNVWGKLQGAQIEYYNNETIDVSPFGGACPICFKSQFLITYNENISETEQIKAIFHELGHLFCRHLYYDKRRIDAHNLQSLEFEAETTAYIVAQRHGVNSNSHKYLALYMSNEKDLPDVNYDKIFRAAGEIEKMITRKLDFSDSLWYKFDNNKKEEYNARIANFKSMHRI